MALTCVGMAVIIRRMEMGNPPCSPLIYKHKFIDGIAHSDADPITLRFVTSNGIWLPFLP